MRNRLDEAKTVFEGGNVALLNLFTIRIFNFSNNVVTSGRWRRCIFASGAITDACGAGVLSFDDSYVDGIGFFSRFELVNIEPEK